MSFIFLLDPLASEPLLQEVLGTEPASRTPVTLDGIQAKETGDTAIHEAHAAEAVAIELSDPASFDRLAYFAETLGAHPVPKHARMGDEQISGILFIGEASPLRANEPYGQDQAWTPIASLAAREIMSYYPRLAACDVARRMPMILARAASRAAAQTVQPPKLRSQNTGADVTLHADHATHEGFFLTRTYDLQHPRFDGTTSARLSREVFIATDAVIVLPYDPVRDRVLLVEQFRMGPYARGDIYPWVLEPVAGRVDAGETHEEAARRECLEEAGLDLGALEHVSSHYCSPGASTEVFHCYVALADLPDDAAGLGGLETEHEDIRTHILSFDAVQDLLTSAEINIGPMILLLYWLERERPRLRASA